MTKDSVLAAIIATLQADLDLLTQAAKTAHAAATHEECAPDNKYDTTALEASYVAQGQANRALEIRLALESYRKLILRPFDVETPIRLTALVTIEDEAGSVRRIFLGPAAGGLKLRDAGTEILVITPESVLGGELLGRVCDDEIEIDRGSGVKSFTIVAVE